MGTRAVSCPLAPGLGFLVGGLTVRQDKAAGWASIVLRGGSGLVGRGSEYDVPVASLLGSSGGHWPCGLEWAPRYRVAQRRLVEKTLTFGTLGKKAPCPPTGLASPCPTQNMRLHHGKRGQDGISAFPLRLSSLDSLMPLQCPEGCRYAHHPCALGPCDHRQLLAWRVVLSSYTQE